MRLLLVAIAALFALSACHSESGITVVDEITDNVVVTEGHHHGHHQGHHCREVYTKSGSYEVCD